MPTAVIFIVGLSDSDAHYNDLMFTNPKGFNIKSYIMDKLPAGTPNLITRWDFDGSDDKPPTVPTERISGGKVAAAINDNFPANDLCIVGFSYGGHKAVCVARDLKRPIKKLILLDPVLIGNSPTKPNTTGFVISSNVVMCECYYRGATANPWSSYVSGVGIPAEGTYLMLPGVRNVKYKPKSSNPWDAHGQMVWDKGLLASIQTVL